MVVLLLALLLAACGGGDEGPRRASLLLDFTPNAVHAGIYASQAGDPELELRVRAPGSSTDSVKLLSAGRTDFAVLDIHDLGLAREKGADLVGVFPLVQRPLAAVIARPGIRGPRDLEGKRVGVTGLPSDVAVLNSVVRGAGGDPRRVKTVTIGFNAVSSLLTGKVDAATAFWNAEGVALRRERPGFREFRVDAFGAPRYPELVVSATRETVEERPELVDRLRDTLRAGYEQTAARPAVAVTRLRAAVPGLNAGLTRAELAALRPALRPVGRLDPAILRAWAAWDVRFGILKRPVDIPRAFDL